MLPGCRTTRRAWLAMMSASTWTTGTVAHAAGDAPDGSRLALLIGNGAYPDGDDLPSVPKHLRDLQAALEKRGFQVSSYLNLDLTEARRAIRAFGDKVAAAPSDAVVWFYFTGQGAEVSGENLLFSANVSTRARAETLRNNSLQLYQDVVGQLPMRPTGLSVAVVDAARTSLRSYDGSSNGDLAQVEAPPGWLLAFSTGAGRTAIAPDDEARSTFYTASLVRLLNESPDEVSFADLFRLVKFDVQETMLNHPVRIIREFAQIPFIADNTRTTKYLGVTPREGQSSRATVGPAGAANAEDGTASDIEWATVEETAWPAEVWRLASSFRRLHANSRWVASATVVELGAAEAIKALDRSKAALDRRAFQVSGERAGGSAADIMKAGRGDKDAAARLGRGFGRVNPSRFEAWMRFAAALDNGIASYELSQYYRRVGNSGEAQFYLDRARQLGYEPSPPKK